MAQSVEFTMWSPHPRAKLYKRYTGNQTSKVKGDGRSPITLDGKQVAVDHDSITIQNNRYVLSGKLKWVEETPKESNDEQPINGLMVENEYLTIKTNSLLNFAVGDIIQLPEGSPFAGFWIVQSGKSIDCIYTPKPVQTFQHLPLSSLG